MNKIELRIGDWAKTHINYLLLIFPSIPIKPIYLIKYIKNIINDEEENIILQNIMGS